MSTSAYVFVPLPDASTNLLQEPLGVITYVDDSADLVDTISNLVSTHGYRWMLEAVGSVQWKKFDRNAFGDIDEGIMTGIGTFYPDDLDWRRYHEKVVLTDFIKFTYLGPAIEAYIIWDNQICAYRNGTRLPDQGCMFRPSR